MKRKEEGNKEEVKEAMEEVRLEGAHGAEGLPAFIGFRSSRLLYGEKVFDRLEENKEKLKEAEKKQQEEKEKAQKTDRSRSPRRTGAPGTTWPGRQRPD